MMTDHGTRSCADVTSCCSSFLPAVSFLPSLSLPCPPCHLPTFSPLPPSFLPFLPFPPSQTLLSHSLHCPVSSFTKSSTIPPSLRHPLPDHISPSSVYQLPTQSTTVSSPLAALEGVSLAVLLVTRPTIPVPLTSRISFQPTHHLDISSQQRLWK